MKPEAFEAHLRAGEIYHGLCVPDEVWPVLRVDGRGFGHLLAACEKPFDPRVHQVMIAVALALVRSLDGLYAYTQSDEISVLLPRSWAQFDRGVEKMVSITAGLASATWATHSTALPCPPGGHYDARIWMGADTDAVCDYFRWRMADCTRHAVQSMAYWSLRGQGKSARAAATHLRGQTTAQIRAWLAAHGHPLETLPPAFRRGSALFWTKGTKAGYNPIKGKTVIAQRRTLTHCSDLPEGEAYSAWLHQVCPSLAPTNALEMTT